MKNVSFLLAVLVAVFTLSVSNVYSNGDDPDNKTFKLKTEVKGHHKADIMVFAWDEESKKWLKVVHKNHKKNLRMYLNPEVNYQVWFTSEDGLTKILYIEAGEPGAWYEEVVIDFNDKKNRYARFYQKNWNYGYAMEKVPLRYKYEGLVVQR